MIFGVCAGIADYFGFDATVTRIVFVLAAFMSFPLLFILYLLLGLLLPRLPFEAAEERPDPLVRRVRSDPHATLGSVRHRFREIDARLQRMEKYVTSSRFKLDREFRQLKD
jgi:phage shock protein C